MKLTAVLLLSTSGACVAGTTSDEPGGSVRIEASALMLNDVVDVCYGLAVGAADGPVWSQSEVCADDFGDGEGSVSYVAPCDATEDEDGDAWNTVTLVLESVEQAAGDDGSWVNPCPAEDPCTQDVDCEENADVGVVFDLVLMRGAKQGFFDIAVEFEDVFCSAKLDCVDQLLLFDCDDRVCAECGDDECDPGEDGVTCKNDCFCGNGSCDDGETFNSCVRDCDGGCGDQFCHRQGIYPFGDENQVTCPADCGTCGNGTCDDPADGIESCMDCVGTCGNGTCDQAGTTSPENPVSCPADCYCGNGTCDLPETLESCLEDCQGHCGDDICGGLEEAECADCTCGNGTCEENDYYNGCIIECTCGDLNCQPYYGENAVNCPTGCYLGNGTCEPDDGENIDNAPGDCTCGNSGCDIPGDTINGCPGECACGNEICDYYYGESTEVCPEDDCECGDGVCSNPDPSYIAVEFTEGCGYECSCGFNGCEPQYGESHTSCADCFCGDGRCELAESYALCALDCDNPCGDGICDTDAGEHADGCPVDCLACSGPCPEGEDSMRGPTAVIALACTAGEGEDTTLSFSEVDVDCGDGSVAIDPAWGPGNLIPAWIDPNPWVFQAATYHGVEQLGDYHKLYANVAIGLVGENCDVSLTATVSAGVLDDGWFPADAIYPFIDIDSTLTADGELICARNPLGSPAVQVRYYNPWSPQPDDPGPFSSYCDFGGCGPYLPAPP